MSSVMAIDGLGVYVTSLRYSLFRGPQYLAALAVRTSQGRGQRAQNFSLEAVHCKISCQVCKSLMLPNGQEELTHHADSPIGPQDGPHACAKSYPMGKKTAREDDELMREVEGRVR